MAKILFIGGTRFVGRAMVEEAIARGHTVTVFHRGLSGADLFPDQEHILGDREGDLSEFDGRAWDWAVDVSGYKPSIVAKSVKALVGKVQNYAFVSTLSVFSDENQSRNITEQSELHQMPVDWDGDETVTPQTYGALKVLCEEEVAKGFGDRKLLYRPGLVVGPHDVTDRFTYWVREGATAEEINIPTTSEQPVQITDARDQAKFLIRLIDQDWKGAVNAVGPVSPITFGGMWQTIQDSLGRSVKTNWDQDGPAPMPAAKGFEFFFKADCSLARSLGFTTRPLADTVRDTWAWDQGRGLPELSSAPSRFKKAD